jgi:Hydrazine synthase alpha subunit middle domain/WD40-like Beta Propeller Repeat
MNFYKTCLVASLVSSMLSACGGGGGSGKQSADAAAVDLPIAYVERPIPKDEDDNPIFPDVFDPSAFNPGAKLMLKDRATNTTPAVDISSAAFPLSDFPVADFPNGPLYDVKDISVSADGTKILFAMRAPDIPNADPEDQPKWNIWEYEIETKTLRRIIKSDIVAEDGHDVSPRYLPNGRIVFASTRQTRSKAILLDDGKPGYAAGTEDDRDQPAFVLHTMDGNEKATDPDIQQITYNQSHDIQPVVLPNGKILYSRWDRFGHDNLSFYTVNPDGTNSQIYYGYNSLNVAPTDNTQNPLRLFNINTMTDGRITAILMPNEGMLGGDMVEIDGANFSENDRLVPGSNSGNANAQQRLFLKPINIRQGDTEFSEHGRFSSVYPMRDGTNRLLVSWSQCRLQNQTSLQLLPCTAQNLENIELREAEPFYGIWVFNISAQTQLPVVLPKAGVMYTEAVSVEKIIPPTNIPSVVDRQKSTGILHIRSVYDVDGVFSRYGSTTAPTDLSAMAAAPAAERPARFIRLIKAVSMPNEDILDFDNSAFGVSGGIMRDILGYLPVEPDGSVKGEVPADVAFTIEVLDANGRRIGPVHRNWLQVRPGETRECNGCHLNTNNVAHGRVGAEAAALNTGAVQSGLQFTNTIRFDNFGTPMTPNRGETMAEFATRSTYCATPGNAATCADIGVRKTSVDLVYIDEWTDESVRAKDTSFEYRYSTLNPDSATQIAPTSLACMDPSSWSGSCRIIINYETHVQPLWERDRPTGACINCHTSNGGVQTPAGQLELTNQPSIAEPDQMASYRELLVNDQVQTPVCELVDDATNAIPLCVVTLDANNMPTCVGVTDCPFEQDVTTGALILDAQNNPIPRTVQTAILASMSANGARASFRFFNKFTNGSGTVNHAGFLNDSELKMISEWLDIRAAYFNNPFDSVQ